MLRLLGSCLSEFSVLWRLRLVGSFLCPDRHARVLVKIGMLHDPALGNVRLAFGAAGHAPSL